MTKDRDFGRLLERHGPPPRVIWITCGNTSNARMEQVLAGGPFESGLVRRGRGPA